MDRAQALNERVGDRLVAQYDNVVATGYGTKQVAGQDTGDQALVVFVKSKETLDGITKQSVDQVLPRKIDGVPLDVVEVGDIVKMIALTTRVRPILPGYSIGHPAVTAGTLGGLFLDRDGQLVVLSNCHVLANENRAQLGDPIYQPGALDAGGRSTPFRGWAEPLCDLPYFATLKEFVPLSVTAANYQDSAIAVIPQQYVSAGLVHHSYPGSGPITGFGTAQPGMQVQKFGRTTGHTTGQVIARGAKFTVGYDVGRVTFEDCVVTSALSQGGDSGSILLDMDMNAVALLFAGSDKVTLFNPIDYARQQYGLQPWTMGEPNQLTLWERQWRRRYLGLNTVQVTPQGIVLIDAPCNQHAYLETALPGPVRVLSLEVFTGSDQGASWGPGLVLTDQAGHTLKLNCRTGNSSYGGWWGQEIIGVGRVEPNQWYSLRISWNQRQAVADASLRGSGRWTRVAAAPGLANCGLTLRIGKTDLGGGSGDHGELGAAGRCQLAGLTLR